MFKFTEKYNKDNLSTLQGLDEDTLQLLIERDYNNQETAKDLLSRLKRMKPFNTIEYNYSKNIRRI